MIIIRSTFIVALALTALGQQRSFRSATNTVEVYATVTDRQGRQVTNLTQADFEIQDNGKTQPITVFDAGVQAITIAVLIDESPSVFESSERIKSAVASFANRLLPIDRAALGAFSHVVRLEPKLQRNLIAQINRIDEGRPRFPAGTAVWDALDSGVKLVGDEPGRQVVLLLTDAEDNCSVKSGDEVRDRVVHRGTMVYAIGVRGDGGLPVKELRDVTRDSGGFYFELKPEDDLAATFARVADELHRQYLIGFSAPALDGNQHQLTLKVKGSGLTARTRKSYFADK